MSEVESTQHSRVLTLGKEVSEGRGRLSGGREPSESPPMSRQAICHGNRRQALTSLELLFLYNFLSFWQNAYCNSS